MKIAISYSSTNFWFSLVIPCGCTWMCGQPKFQPELLTYVSS